MMAKLWFIIPFSRVTAGSKGKNSHTFPKISPSNSFGKYIPLVKHTSCTKMLEIPEDAFSEKILPMRIPSAIKRIAITSETRPAKRRERLKESPKQTASRKNKMFCTSKIGRRESI